MVLCHTCAEGAAFSTQLTFAAADELIGWRALSGMVVGADGIVYLVNDSDHGMQPSTLTVDTARSPARNPAKCGMRSAMSRRWQECRRDPLPEGDHGRRQCCRANERPVL
jgi:hypothetical protein